MTEQRREAASAVEPAPAPALGARPAPHDVIFDVNGINVHYGPHRAIRDVTLDVHLNEIRR